MTDIERRAVIKTALAVGAAAAIPSAASAADKPLAGKSVLITGASSGFGYLGALHYARLGAKVIAQDWLGFGPQKQFAVTAAHHNWVLCLDADERVSPELQSSIKNELKNPSTAAFRFARCNRFLGRYLKHGEGYPDWSLRLFDRRQARWSADAVHEKVETLSAVGELSGDLLHESAESLSSYLSKQNRYTTLAAEMALAAGKRASFPRIALSPIIRFIKFYFVRQGFRDGLPGLIHIAIGCFNSMMKYSKMLERQK